MSRGKTSEYALDTRARRAVASRRTDFRPLCFRPRRSARAAVFPLAPCSGERKREVSGRVFARAAGVLVCAVFLVSGCGLVPRSQSPQEALGLPQAETPFAQRESIEEYLRTVEPVMRRFVHALAEKEGVIGVEPRRFLNACTDRGPGKEEGWAFGTEVFYISSLTDKDIEDAASQYLSVLPSYKGTRGDVQKDGSFVLRSGDAGNGGELSVYYFPDNRSSIDYRSGCRPSDGSMGDLNEYVLPTVEEAFPDLVVYPAFDEDTKQPNTPPPPRNASGQSGQSGQPAQSGDESGEGQ